VVGHNGRGGGDVKALLEYGLLVLFVWVFVEQGGIPLPVAPLLLAVGALAAAQQMSLPLALVVTIVASLLADLLWYVIGRRRGGEALGVLCRVTLEPDYCVRRAQDLFLKHRLRSLLLGKFLPGINPLVAGLAGVAGIGVGRFVVYDVGSAALWAGTWTGLGYLLRDVLEEVTAWLSQLGEWAIALVAAVLAGYIGIKYAQRRRFLRQLRIARIAPEEVRRRLAAGEPTVVVDLRTSLDAAGVPFTIPGALRMSPDELESRHAEISRDAEIVLVCT
jgi:membrane protein DedA with SNARE-associated domain